jgi:hypothetical protein
MASGYEWCPPRGIVPGSITKLAVGLPETLPAQGDWGVTAGTLLTAGTDYQTLPRSAANGVYPVTAIRFERCPSGVIGILATVGFCSGTNIPDDVWVAVAKAAAASVTDMKTGGTIKKVEQGPVTKEFDTTIQKQYNEEFNRVVARYRRFF